MSGNLLVANKCLDEHLDKLDIFVEKKDNKYQERLIKLPLSRLKIICKSIPEVHLVNSEALAIIGRACEQFVSELSRDSFELTFQDGKKTLSKLHVLNTCKSNANYEFLDGICE